MSNKYMSQSIFAHSKVEKSQIDQEIRKKVDVGQSNSEDQEMKTEESDSVGAKLGNIIFVSVKEEPFDVIPKAESVMVKDENTGSLNEDVDNLQKHESSSQTSITGQFQPIDIVEELDHMEDKTENIVVKKEPCDTGTKEENVMLIDGKTGKLIGDLMVKKESEEDSNDM